MPGFVPNYTGYDLDQQDMNWRKVYDDTAPDNWLIYVRLVTSASFYTE